MGDELDHVVGVVEKPTIEQTSTKRRPPFVYLAIRPGPDRPQGIASDPAHLVVRTRDDVKR